MRRKNKTKERRKDVRQTESPWTHDDYADVSENDKLPCKYLFLLFIEKTDRQWNYRIPGPLEWKSSFLKTQKDIIQYAFLKSP